MSSFTRKSTICSTLEMENLREIMVPAIHKPWADQFPTQQIMYVHRLNFTMGVIAVFHRGILLVELGGHSLRMRLSWAFHKARSSLIHSDTEETISSFHFQIYGTNDCKQSSGSDMVEKCTRWKLGYHKQSHKVWSNIDDDSWWHELPALGKICNNIPLFV